MNPKKSTTKGTTPIELSKNANTVLERRYLKKDDSHNVLETPDELITRVAQNIAEAELKFGGTKSDVKKWMKEFYLLMTTLKFMPNSPTLMNAGADLQQLSACFVLPVGDSMEDIFETIKNTALIHKSGGGTGFSFSRLRPKSDVVQSTKGVSSGPISFMRVFNAATEAIKQGGTRRGANMGILKVDHPDIEDFISCKADLSELNNFNISVALTEEFMEKARNSEDFSLLNPRNGEPMGSLNAGKIFASIIEKAWGSGEPGIVFIDRINRDNPTPSVGEIESTNPCGEQPLLPYESCNLGSLNLDKFLKETSKGLEFNWDELTSAINTSVRFLDNVIEMNNYPLKEIRRMTYANRKIGLGLMGFADLLLHLGIPYNSKEATDLGEKIMSFIYDKSIEASRELATERGEFPNFNKSIFKEKGEPPIRNATTTTIAPTGTISIIAGCSSGIEPLFAISYVRTVMDNDRLVEVNPIFEKVAKEREFYSEELMERIADAGTIAHFDEIPEDVRRVFVTAHDISPEWHIRMQAAFQKHCDNAVSKTVNFPNSATQEDVAKVYWLAYELGCKGVTIYRDGSRQLQVLSTGATSKKSDVPPSDTPSRLIPRKRPDIIVGSTRKVKTGCGNMYITVNEDEYGLYEVFSQLGKTGGCISSHVEAISRLISLALKSGIDPEKIVDQLRGIRCPNPTWHHGKLIASCSDAIGQVIEDYIAMRKARKERGQLSLGLNEINETTNGNGTAKKARGLKIADMGPECPECGGMLEFSEGCVKCRSCGYSKC
ncbi:vitamin B12-dependent ribonucleotide reductase [bacterium]|nr:vitamin B12-dependent ribonucleotide reductase [bacterium]